MAQHGGAGAVSGSEDWDWEAGPGASGSDSEQEDRPAAAAGEPDFYDPGLDDRDEQWVARQRAGRQSDAHLSCPGCFTSLCTDCQQHAQAPHRYRAVFVFNCRVDRALQEAPRGSRKQRGKRRRGQAAIQEVQPAEVFHPVFCSECDTKVGAWSPDGVFHFFAVIASTA